MIPGGVNAVETFIESEPNLTPVDSVSTSGRVRRRLVVHIAQLTFLGLIVLLWQVSPPGVIPPIAVSRPGPVASELWRMLSSGQLIRALGATGREVLDAMVISAPLGIGLAVAASNRVIGWLLEPIVTVAYAVPKVGLISIYILILGVNTESHVALVVSTIVFVYYYALRQAVSDVDTAALSAFRLMGASRWKVLWSLILPSSTPHLLGATRVALPLAFATEIFAELRVPTKGLGVLLGNFTYNSSASQSAAVAIFIAAVAYVVDIVIGRRLRRYSNVTGLGAGT